MRKEKDNRTDQQMTDNGIGVEGAKVMSEMLKDNTTLKSLNLWSKEEER